MSKFQKAKELDNIFAKEIGETDYSLSILTAFALLSMGPRRYGDPLEKHQYGTKWRQIFLLTCTVSFENQSARKVAGLIHQLQILFV